MSTEIWVNTLCKINEKEKKGGSQAFFSKKINTQWQCINTKTEGLPLQKGNEWARGCFCKEPFREGGSNVKQSLIYEIRKQKQVEINNVDDSFFCEITAPRHHSLPQ